MVDTAADVDCDMEITTPDELFWYLDRVRDVIYPLRSDPVFASVERYLETMSLEIWANQKALQLKLGVVGWPEKD